MQVLYIINYIPSSKPDKETSHFLWPAYCSNAGKSHTSAAEHLFLFSHPSLLFFSPWLNALKSERLWHRFDRLTSEIPSLEEIKAVWCPALMEGGADELVSEQFSLQSWCGREKKKRHIELLVLSFRPRLGGYRLWQRFIFTPLHPRLCVREFVGESAPMWKSNGNPDLSSLPPEPWQHSAGQSRLAHQKLSNQTEMTEAISVARKLHEDEMFTQTWNGIEMKWSQMTPRTCFGSCLQPVLFRALWISLVWDLAVRPSVEWIV